MGILTSSHDKGEKDLPYGYSQYPFGPNMAIRRQCILNRDRAYPEYLGPGTGLPVGDEPTFLSSLSPPDASDRMYIANACVRHDVEKENVVFLKALQRCCHAGFAHGKLGFFRVSHQAVMGNSSIPSLIVQRLGACRSMRELICITSRYLFYIHGWRACRPSNHNLHGN